MGSADTPPPAGLAPGRSDPSAPTSSPTSGLREQSPHSGTLPDLVPRPSRASPAQVIPRPGSLTGPQASGPGSQPSPSQGHGASLLVSNPALLSRWTFPKQSF